MASSLHVSLPDEMRAYVDRRTNGKNPSEYVRALIQLDMEKEAERRYVFGELLRAAQEIKNGDLISSEQLEQEMDEFLAKLEAEDRECASKSAV
jgi:antitoxin ParD1/3/4